MNSKVHRYGVIEFEMESDYEYSNPAFVEVFGEFTSPSGKITKIRAFWDGARIWKLRFSPDEIGKWKWRVITSNKKDLGLNKIGEQFECEDYKGENILYKRGPLKVSADGTHFIHANGTPFFWLGDTAWNGVIRGNDENWHRYLEIRARQRFNVIQFVSAHWRGDEEDEFGEKSCTDDKSPIEINPRFFQRIDRRIAMINEYGHYGAPVVLWTLLETDVGQKLSEKDALALAKYIVARYDAYQVVWLLGGDGDYQKIGVERWKRIGREVFKYSHDRLVSLHPCGQNWIGEEFRNESWFDFIGYQSGHGDAEYDSKWLNQGPPACNWKNLPIKPVINLEPNYEHAIGYHKKIRFNQYHVRRAAYWSLFVSPTAGITYGHDAIWNWNFEEGPSEGHGDLGNRKIPPWYTGLETEGIKSMTILRNIIESFRWYTFKPCDWILKEQPGLSKAEEFVSLVKSDDGVVLAYLPRGGKLNLKDELKFFGPAWLINPVTGDRTKLSENVKNPISSPNPDHDWLVSFRMESA